ncbi:hypothetical protein AMTRI_Chr06g198910 [Amborella trichopoda]|uniref:Protein kinase domain-containing protein n=1 Tax=Amborella trichopoda TaxID=13333 RepID=W1PZM6_AMBTC|nr:hypothetical protein AMTR_s00049p00233230 [Amborella trichopoda]
MNSLWFFIWVLNLGALRLISAQQSYDETGCDDVPFEPGSKYTCNTLMKSCQTYAVYRAQQNYQTISAISLLFDLNENDILQLNNITEPLQTLDAGREVLIPVICSCSGQYYQSNFSYITSDGDDYSHIACGIFEGLSKTLSLLEQNPYLPHKLRGGLRFSVPIKCACPNNQTISNGYEFLITYPIITNDKLTGISIKFNVPEQEIVGVNNMKPYPTIYPLTTLIVPAKKIPVLNLTVTATPEDSNIEPGSVIPKLGKVQKNKRNSKAWSCGLILGVGVSFAFLAFIFIGSLLVIINRRKKVKKLLSSSERSSQVSSLSPDLLVGMFTVKHPLLSYRLEELKVATGDFGEASKIGKLVYRGRLNSSKVAIKQMGSREVRSVINILTKINHVNLARLLGVCYGRSEQNPTFLVFEFAERGSLRDQLSKYSRSFELEWGKRMRIAFDMAIGLHYIHHCITPSYVHMDISSENVLVTSDWRAKIANFKHAKRVTATEDGYSSTEIGGLVMCRKGCMAPELLRGMVSPKVDVFAFGVVLLELISARETTGEMLLRDSVGFLRGGESEEGCTEKLRSFMDPSLKGDYPVNEALFLALLAKACTEEDPFHRPTMNDIVKALSKMI